MSGSRVFREILALSDGPVRYRLEGDLIGMAHRHHPLSISPVEFDYLGDFVRRHGLRRGYEVATAFGVSALALGLGFRRTGGRLVTMDAYVEEHHGHCDAYRGGAAEVYAHSDGYRSVTDLIRRYGLQEHVFATIGWSPTDTERCLRTVFRLEREPLDLVFIDGGHFPEQVIRDLESIRPYLAGRFAVFLHDNYPAFINDEVKRYIGRNFDGLELTIVVPHGPGRNLSLLSNLE
jgi:hypothetical protein